jgi:hypothetical protein
MRDAGGNKTARTPMVVKGKAGKRLAGPQLVFNRLVKRITTLERKIGTDRRRLEVLAGLFVERVAPVEVQLARRQLELAHALSAAHRRAPLTKRQARDLRYLILSLCEDAFRVTRPDAAATALHDEWSKTGHHEQVQRRTASLKEQLRDEFRHEFGFDPDVADDGDDSPDGFARFRRQMGERVRMADEEQARAAREAAMRRNPEGMRRAADSEALRRRSIREIYLALAKLLHPDAVTDPGERATREHDMKQATAAYESDDLVRLLELEARWTADASERLGAAGSDVLGFYISTLKERAAVLAKQLRQQKYAPEFARIAPVAGLKEPDAVAGIEAHADELARKTERLGDLLAKAVACRSRAELGGLVSACFAEDEGSIEVALRLAFGEE